MVESASSEKQQAEKRSAVPDDEPNIESLKLEIENSRLKEKEYEILLSCNNDIASIRDKNDLLQVIHNKLKRLFNIRDVFICKIDEKRENIVPFLRVAGEQLSSHKNFERLIQSQFSLIEGSFNRILSSKEPVIFDLERAYIFTKYPEYWQFLKDGGLREGVLVCLFNGDDQIGTLTLYSEKKNTFNSEHFTLITSIAAQLSIAVTNILANEELKRREKEKSVLLALSNDIANTKNKKDLLHIINSKLKTLFYFTHSVIGVINNEKRTYNAFIVDLASKSAGHTDYEEIVIKTHYPINDGVVNIVLQSSSPVVFDLDKLNDEIEMPRYLKLNHGIGIKEVIMVALRKDEENIGVQVLFSDRKAAFNSDNLSIIQGISHQLSIAVANCIANEKIARQLEEINHYKQRLEDENLYLQEEIQVKYNYSEIVGSGMEMQRVFRLVAQVANSDSTVLILGETGTGKELIARAIHNSSHRKDKLMVKVNCAALPANLIESELFGHEKGSFTGAVERRIGKFELANNSTLFLDEIGELPLELQVKLLRALQEKEIERVGGKSTIKINVRIIAATNRDLQGEVNTGKFRSDLYYRLNVFPITLTPLRGRKEDIPLLVSHFIARYARSTGKKVTNIAHHVLEELSAYSWPGNVRELEHLIERTILLTNGRTIKEIHLPVKERKDPAGSEKHLHIKTIDENERDHILRVLKICNGKVAGERGAANLLGVPTSTLNSKMKKLGIKKEHIFSHTKI